MNLRIICFRISRHFSSGGSPSAARGGREAVKESVIALNEASRQASPFRPQAYYLDTHSVIMQLQDAGQQDLSSYSEFMPVLSAGYSLQQAEGLVKVLSQTLERAIFPMERSILSQRDLVWVQLLL